MEDSTIRQTAIDYDMEYHQVKRIHNFYPSKFYEKLEEFIKERANKNNPPKENNGND